jgi:hypothetical protein
MRAADKQRPAPGTLVLDHVSHFVADLDAAAALLQELGFAVTPRSEQKVEGEPVGAANRCVMLEEGYIEILAPTLDTPAARRMRGSIERFVGVHLACFGTPDAEAEHRRLAAHGFEPQPLVDLQREVEAGSGKLVRFKVVRPAPEKMPEGRIQYVQQLAPEAIWTDANLAHDNGVVALRSVLVVAEDPIEAAARWARFTGLMPHPENGAVVLKAARGRVAIASREDFSRLLFSCPSPPALAGYALGCRDPERFAARLAGAGIAVRQSGARYAAALPAVLGGAWLLEPA